MIPFTLEDAEHELSVAIRVGDADAIDRAAALVDHFDTGASPPPPLLAAALWYAEHGLPVFPLQPGTKVPLRGSRGCKDATTDASQIRVWWEATPDANIGLATGHLVDVVDIDGETGQLSRAQAWDEFESLTVLGKVTTPRAGGMHLYVPAAGHGNKAGLLPGIDYRGAGGYVVAPPSLNGEGVAYRWLNPLDVTSLVKPVAA